MKTITISKTILGVLLFISVNNINVLKAQTLDWQLVNFGPTRRMENVEKGLTHFHLYQANFKRFVLTNEVISTVPGFSKQNYPVFLGEGCAGNFNKSFLTNASAVKSSFHSQNVNGSSFSGSTFQDSDWGQNIQSYVNRAKTVSFVVNQIALKRDVAYVGGDGGYAGKYYLQFSDSVLKNNVTTITDALEKVKLLRGVYFTYKPDSCDDCDTNAVIQNDETTHMGLIAQEVERIVPEVVRDQYTGYKAVSYANLVGLLIEAIKELNNKIDDCCNAAGVTSGINNVSVQKKQTENLLFQNNPNPFNSSTEIKFYVTEKSQNASILIFDMNGKEVKKFKIIQKGNNSITISTNELPTGMYFYTLFIDGKDIDTKKMILTSE